MDLGPLVRGGPPAGGRKMALCKGKFHNPSPTTTLKILDVGYLAAPTFCSHAKSLGDRHEATVAGCRPQNGLADTFFQCIGISSLIGSSLGAQRLH